MRNYSEFHDGLFEGLRISNNEVTQVYLRTKEGRCSTVTMTGVVMLRVSGFKEGNIVFDVNVRERDEITLQDVAELYELTPTHEIAPWERELLERAKKELRVLEITSSYGASGLVLAQTVDFS